MTDAPFLNVAGVAARLKAGEHKVLALIHSGELPAVDVSLKPGGRPRWRVLPDDFDAFLARRTFSPPAPRRRRRKPPAIKRFF